MTAKDKQQQIEAIQFWHESAQRDRATAQSLFEQKHHDWSLFVYHLAIEKLLKGLIMAAEKTPPYAHDLERLAAIAELPTSTGQKDKLMEITKYNIEAHYPNEKLALYRKATPEYTSEWQKHCENIDLLLENTLLQKIRQ